MAFELKKLLNPFRQDRYSDKQLIKDLRQLVDDLNKRLAEIEAQINSM